MALLLRLFRSQEFRGEMGCPDENCAEGYEWICLHHRSTVEMAVEKSDGDAEELAYLPKMIVSPQKACYLWLSE